MEPLHLAYSPCPNDTFIFHGWVHGLVADAPPVRETLHDIDELNAMAQRGEPDVLKLSFPALARVLDRYALLRAGGAVGRGAGPLLVASAASELAPLRGEELQTNLRGARVAIPGELTSAALLFRLFIEAEGDTRVVRYDEIMPAVAAGQVDAGVIIHESRFTYPLYGLHCLQDLGEWWENETGRPIPLGGVAVRRDLGRETAAAAQAAIRASLRGSREHPEQAQDYIRGHAQEMDSAVCREHIELYVNEFSEDYGAEGEAAVKELMVAARRRGLAPALDMGLFWDDE
jgi:1,4-dihydroxy-6-naphthoate synthase